LGYVEEETAFADKSLQELRPDQAKTSGLGKPNAIGYSGLVTKNQ
jgi:hypothetical protein